MTERYVWNGATGAADGTSWADAYTTLGAAFTVASWWDVIYVAHDHTESHTGDYTLNAAVGLFVTCVDRAGSVPPVPADIKTRSAQISCTGILTLNGYVYYSGMIFYDTGVNGIILNSSGWNPQTYKRCRFRMNSAGGTVQFLATGHGYTTWDDCTFYSNIDRYMSGWGHFRWRNTDPCFEGFTPTNIFQFSTPNHAAIFCENLNLSAQVASNNIGTSNLLNRPDVYLRILNCRLAANAGIAPNGHPFAFGELLNSSNGTAKYQHWFQRNSQNLQVETTVVREGGAQIGGTPISWKFSGGHSSFYDAWQNIQIASEWNNIVGQELTATVEGVWGGGSTPTNKDIHLEIIYPASATSPLGGIAHNRYANWHVSTAVNHPSSNESWGGGTTKFKLEVPFTPQMPGRITGRIKTTATGPYYIDPIMKLVA